MTRLSLATIGALFALFILSVGSEKVLNKRDVIEVHLEFVKTDDVIKWFCEQNPFAPFFSICTPYVTNSTMTTAAPPPPTAAVGGEEINSTSEVAATSTVATIDQDATNATSATTLERAHWCRFSNGTYVPMAYTFMYSSCQLCQCTQSRNIRCTTLQCMPTYCIDGSDPSPKQGQCCPQCGYEVNSTSCVQNGMTFPHGSIIKRTSDNVQCWCQLGTIECRKIGVSIFAGLDLWGEGTAIYVVVVILCVLLIIGTLLCGGCSLIYYYYYHYTQSSAEEAYWNNAGWQPMGDEEQVADGTAENKQVEAEQNQFEQNYPTGYSEEFVPPPYALYNGTFEGEQAEKNQKYI